MSKPLPRQAAYVHRESWAGRTKDPVHVIAETPKYYVVEGVAGTRRVPKYAVEFRADSPVSVNETTESRK